MASIDALNLETFLTIFMLTFALFLLVAGVFTAYFGSGKSRKIGGGLLAFGLILGLIWVLISTQFGSDLMGRDNPIISLSPSLMTIVIQAVVAIIAAVIGALAAIGLFLAAIMKA